MIGFCGAFDKKNKRVDFSVLKKMCGLHSGGCAFIKDEIGILCDKPVGDGELRPLTLLRNSSLYTSAILCDTPFYFNERVLTEGYINDGVSFFGHMDFPFMLALYDSHHGELMLCNGENSEGFIFYTEKGGVLYFASSLRAMIRLFCGCVKIRGDVLCKYILGEYENIPDGLFCDINIIYPEQMLTADSFGRNILPINKVECSIKAEGREICESAKPAEHDQEDIREMLCSKLFLLDIPYFDIPEGKTRDIKRMEKQIDKILAGYEKSSYRSALLDRGVSAERIGEQKSIALRVKQKAMLAQALMWFDTFNFVLC